MKKLRLDLKNSEWKLESVIKLDIIHLLQDYHLARFH